MIKEVKLLLNEKGEFSIQSNVKSFEALGMIEYARTVLIKDIDSPDIIQSEPVEVSTEDLREKVLGQDISNPDYASWREERKSGIKREPLTPEKVEELRDMSEQELANFNRSQNDFAERILPRSVIDKLDGIERIENEENPSQENGQED